MDPLEDAAAYSPVATFCIHQRPSELFTRGEKPIKTNADPYNCESLCESYSGKFGRRAYQEWNRQDVYRFKPTEQYPPYD